MEKIMDLADKLEKILSEAIPIPTKKDVDRLRAARERAAKEREARAQALKMPEPEPEPEPEEPKEPVEEPKAEFAPEEPKEPAPEEPEAEPIKTEPEVSAKPKEIKTERIEMRVSPEDKASMLREAESLNLTLSAYLLFLHANHIKKQD